MRVNHWTVAGMALRVTIDWDAAPRLLTPRGASEALHPTLAQIAAKRRMEASLEAVGRGALVHRLSGRGYGGRRLRIGLTGAFGAVVVTLALDRLADF